MSAGEVEPRAPVPSMTEAEWRAEAMRRFGPDPLGWRFVCPVCAHEAAIQAWKDAGASDREAAFSCVGRHIDGSKEAFSSGRGGPCTYAGGGLFRLNPQPVVHDDGAVSHMFAFADVAGARA